MVALDDITDTSILIPGVAVDVAAFATGGKGTKADPWTGWDTAITWASAKRYIFRTGYFGLAAALVIPDNVDMTWEGDGINRSFIAWHNTTTTAGTYMMTFNTSLVAGATVNWVGGNNLVGITLDGTYTDGNGTHYTCPNALLWSSQIRFCMRNVSFQNVSDTACKMEACVCGVVDNMRISFNDATAGTPTADRPTYIATPNNGLVVDKLAHGSDPGQSTCIVFNSLVVEKCGSGSGVHLANCFELVFNGGTSEGHTGIGLKIDSGATRNNLNGFDLESSTGGDLVDAGSGNVFVVGECGDITTSTGGETFIGCDYNNMTINGQRNTFISGSIRGTLSEGSPGTNTWINVFNNIAIGTATTARIPLNFQNVISPFAYTLLGTTPTIHSDWTKHLCFFFDLASSGADQTATLGQPDPFVTVGGAAKTNSDVFGGIAQDVVYYIRCPNDSHTYTIALGTGWSLATGVTMPTITSHKELVIKARYNQTSNNVNVMSATVLT